MLFVIFILLFRVVLSFFALSFSISLQPHNKYVDRCSVRYRTNKISLVFVLLMRLCVVCTQRMCSNYSYYFNDSSTFWCLCTVARLHVCGQILNSLTTNTISNPPHQALFLLFSSFFLQKKQQLDSYVPQPIQVLYSFCIN